MNVPAGRGAGRPSQYHDASGKMLTHEQMTTGDTRGTASIAEGQIFEAIAEIQLLATGAMSSGIWSSGASMTCSTSHDQRGA